MPLPFHKYAQLAAEASEEVLAQKGAAAFWTYHDMLYEAQSEPDGLERVNLDNMPTSWASTWRASRRPWISTFIRARSKRHRRREHHRPSTARPAFVINDYYLSGAQPGRRLQEADQARTFGQEEALGL